MPSISCISGNRDSGLLFVGNAPPSIGRRAMSATKDSQPSPPAWNWHNHGLLPRFLGHPDDSPSYNCTTHVDLHRDRSVAEAHS